MSEKSVEEVLREADKVAGVPESEAGISAPADAMDLHHRISKADQSPAEGVEELVAKEESKEEEAAPKKTSRKKSSRKKASRKSSAKSSSKKAS